MNIKKEETKVFYSGQTKTFWNLISIIKLFKKKCYPKCKLTKTGSHLEKESAALNLNLQKAETKQRKLRGTRAKCRENVTEQNV
jgi:endonuclease V-like protein UPF0215 family